MININRLLKFLPTTKQPDELRRTESTRTKPSDSIVLQTRGRSLSAPASVAVALLLTPTTASSQEVHSTTSSCLSQSDDSQAAKRRIQQALYPIEVTTVQPIAPGHSGAQVYRAASAQGQQYFAKIVRTWADISNPAELRKEFVESAWAGTRGFAPPVVFSDPEQGTLVTEFLTNQMADWNQGGQEPRLSATLFTMRRLHLCETSGGQKSYDRESAVLSWEKERKKVSPEDQQIAFVQAAAKIALACINALSEQTFDVVVRHGDLHQSNVIYNSGQAWLIDWGTKNYGDAMQEVAYYAYHVDVPMSQFDSVLEKYASLSPEDSNRARYHLALMHAHRYLQTLRGMPWDLPQWRDSKLRMHESYLTEDLDWLSLQSQK